MHPLEAEVKGGDLELVRKCQAGCRDSFDSLVIKYQKDNRYLVSYISFFALPI